MQISDQLVNTVVGPGAAQNTQPGGGGEKPESFADTLKDAVVSTDQRQKEADQAILEANTGQGNSLHETMIAMEKADISLKLMVQIRNKCVDAYKEIMRMQV